MLDTDRARRGNGESCPPRRFDAFYSAPSRSVRVGLEAIEHAQWFERFVGPLAPAPPPSPRLPVFELGASSALAFRNRRSYSPEPPALRFGASLGGFPRDVGIVPSIFSPIKRNITKQFHTTPGNTPQQVLESGSLRPAPRDQGRRDREVGGSNPLAPTICFQQLLDEMGRQIRCQCLLD